MDEETVRQRRAQRELLKQTQRDLFQAVLLALANADPLQLIAEEAPADEYEPEAGTIVPRLKEARDVEDVERILHEEFVTWFGAGVAGPRDAYRSASVAVWRARQQFGV
jgi:hypothetical protein